MSNFKYGVAEFDAFARSCPYFDPASPVNNGYGCNHKEQEETDDYEPVDPDEEGEDLDGYKAGTYGKCHCWSCPIGMEAEEEDISKPEVFWDGLTPDPEAMENEYLMVPMHESVGANAETIDAWTRYQAYLNRYNKTWMPKDALKPFIVVQEPAQEPTDQDIAAVMFHLGYEVAAGATAAARNLRKKTGDEVLSMAKDYASEAKNAEIQPANLADFVTDKINHDKRLDPMRIVTCECEKCGTVFGVCYHADGSYEYANAPCECEADFRPINGEPSISEWLETLF